jgi:hypothetical protein
LVPGSNPGRLTRIGAVFCAMRFRAGRRKANRVAKLEN